MKFKTLIGAMFLVVAVALGSTLGLRVLSSVGNTSLKTNEATLGTEDYLAQSCTEPEGGCGTDYYWDSSYCLCRPYDGGGGGGCEEPTEGCGMNHYWDSGSCSCVYSGSCNEPTEGCGTNYYWDAGSCSCEFYCAPPETGCGVDYYWDSGSCSCVYSGPSGCTEPAGGCGVDYAWDSGKCECRPYDSSGGGWCVEPEGGCNPDSYWDSGSCSCVYSGPSGCTEPSGGCGEYSWWDAYSCTCKSDYCSPPSTGCGTNQYWDSYSCTCRESCERPASCGVDSIWDYYDCECRSGTSCSPPAAGCGADYYWDTYYCSCKPYQNAATTSSCSPPAAGCGENYYWDDYSCNCKQYPSHYGCYEPSGGCGYGWYWNDDSCVCKSESDETYYSTETYSSYVYDQNFDRLAYEPPERINCVKSLLTPTEYERLRYLVPSTNSEQDEIHRLGRKVESCWSYSVSGGQGDFADASVTYVSPIQREQCFIDALGSKVYNEIYKGEREPTYEEHLFFEKCYGGVSSDTVIYATNDQSLPNVVEDCLKSVLQEGLYEDVKSGSAEVPFELRDKVDRCFGIDPHPFEEGKSYAIPEDIRSCLLQAIGQERFDQINLRGSEPSDLEKAKGEVCFNRLNKDQVSFLPPPPEQVPFLNSDPEIVNFANIWQDTKEFGDQILGGKVVFSGSGPPNSTITIYIYSEPIVVTTKTDENGDWVYELEKPLEGEKHIAYAIVRSDSGDVVRSTVFDFTVVAAESDLALQLLRESKVSRTLPKFATYALIVIGAAGIVVVGSMGFLYAKKLSLAKKESESDSLSSSNNREGKGNAGSSSVN